MLRFLIIVISFYTVSGVEYAPVIQIDSGLVRGFRSQLNDNSVVDIYQGIRYGKFVFVENIFFSL